MGCSRLSHGVHTAYFEGVLFDGNVTTLDDAYVETKFYAEFLARVREEGERHTKSSFICHQGHHA